MTNVDITTPAARRQYFPIYLDSLRLDDKLDFDLYIERGKEYVLYRAARLPFTEKTRLTLLENNITRLFVSAKDQRTYQFYLESNLSEIVEDSSIAENARSGIVYESAKFLIRDLFSKPTLGENIGRSKELVESTVGFVLTSRTAISSLLRIMAFDYTTYTHSVNVCALSLALARHIGIKNPRDLRALGCGALLHDIGKTKISESILNKSEALTPDEMFLIRRHPQWGCELLRETDMIDAEAYFPVLQHHERLDCSGYPGAVGGKHIHLYGRITAIADVFDAMTTRRTYRPAKETYPALKEMFLEQAGFDPELLSEFAKMLGPSGLIDD